MLEIQLLVRMLLFFKLIFQTRNVIRFYRYSLPYFARIFADWLVYFPHVICYIENAKINTLIILLPMWSLFSLTFQFHFRPTDGAQNRLPVH